MTLLYRITHVNFAHVLNGLGGSYEDGGRWNLPGQPVVYLAWQPATALLEMGNYIPNPRNIPSGLVLAEYEVPDDFPVDELHPSKWPSDWRSHPFPASTQAIGGAWIDAMSGPLLSVPSVAVPSGLDSICLLNPRHPKAGLVTHRCNHTDLYNERLFSGA